MPGQTNPLSPGAAAAAPAPPPTRREIERKLSMRSASASMVEPPKPRRSSIVATSPIVPTPINANNLHSNNSLTTQFNNINHANQIPAGGSTAATAMTNTTTTTPSNLTMPPKGTSVLSSIRERGENDTTTVLSDRDIEEEDELDEEEDEEGEEDEVGMHAGAGAGLGGGAGAGVMLEFPDGQRMVDGEELKRGMEGERMVKSGYLMKKGEKRKNWKKRWFVLRTEKLAYYRDEKEYMLCQILSLRGIHSVVSVQLKKHSHAFGIITAKRTFYVRAGSQQEMEGWIHAINDARRNLAESDERTRDGGGPSEGERGGGAVPQSGQSGIPIPSKAGGSGLGVGMGGPSMTGPSNLSEGFGQYGVSPGYTELPLGSYTPQRTGSISHSIGNSMYGSQLPQTPGGLPIPGIESQLDKLGLGEHHQIQGQGQQNQAGGSGYASGMTTSTVSDRARTTSGFEPPTPGGTTKRDRSAGSISSIPLEGGSYIPGGPGPSLLPQAFLPTSSDEEDDAFIPRSVQYGQGPSGHSNIAGMMAMSPTTHASSPMGHPPLPSSSSYAQGQGQGYTSPGPIQTDPKKVILNGYLMKLGTRGKKTWRKRWFVLTSGDLVYTRSHMDTKVHRQIPLSSILDAIDLEPLSPSGSETSDSEDARVGADHSRSPTSPRKPRHSQHRERVRARTIGVGNGGGGGGGGSGMGGDRGAGGGKHHLPQAAVRHAFQVITPQRTFKLCAPSEEEEIKWVAALRALINRERGMLSPVMAMGGTLGGHISRVQPPPATPSVQSSVQQEDVTSYFPLGQPLPTSTSYPQAGGGSVPGVSPSSLTPGLSLSGMNPTTSSSSTRPPRASPSHLPPLITTQSTPPTHHRTRSATQSAKAAVAEVVRRFNPEGGASG